MTATLLDKAPLFASLPDEERRHLAETVRRLQIAAGTILLREGDPGDRFYFIHEGELEIVKAMGTPDERVLTVEGPGAFVGEMSLLNPDRRRTASARARSPVRISEIMHSQLEALLRRQPGLAYEMARVLSGRLQAVNDATIRELHQKNAALRETNRQLLAAYEELRAAQDQIVEKEALERELQVAREIQISMLPRTLPEVEGFTFGARMVPARAVGGDFFDFIPLDRDAIGIVVGDVTGKGVPAALVMALTRSLLRAEARRARTPRETLENVNRILLDINDTGMFVTVLYGVLNCSARDFSYARAGHERPLVLDAQGGASVPPLGLGVPLGVLPDTALDEQLLSIPPGGMLLLYTDGVTDAVNAEGTFFDFERLRETIVCRQATAQAACDRLVEALRTYRGTAPQADDITLVAVQAD